MCKGGRIIIVIVLADHLLNLGDEDANTLVFWSPSVLVERLFQAPGVGKAERLLLLEVVQLLHPDVRVLCLHEERTQELGSLSAGQEPVRLGSQRAAADSLDASRLSLDDVDRTWPPFQHLLGCEPHDMTALGLGSLQVGKGTV